MSAALNNVYLYPTENKILTEAGINRPQTTDSLQTRADELFKEVQKEIARSCLSWLSYKTGFGTTARRFALGKDLLTVKNDIENRKDNQLGDLVNTVTTSALMLGLTVFTKAGPTTGNRYHYRNRY